MGGGPGEDLGVLNMLKRDEGLVRASSMLIQAQSRVITSPGWHPACPAPYLAHHWLTISS